MVREGVNVKQLQVLLGHATIGVTLDTYSHLFDDDLPAALPEVVSAKDPVAA
jgi:site-specific recombinase XerD